MERERGASIALNQLTVCYGGVTALAVERARFQGNIIAILGHNGAGKSTLIKSILGLLPITSGNLTIEYYDGVRARPLSPERDMAFCPETGSVFADITVESYIKLWCRIKHADGNYYRKAGSKYIEMLSLTTLLTKLGRELSKGQRRRVQTAIGFLTDPQLFLFDEPFDGLDVQKTNELTTILQEESSRRSFVVSSHRMDVVERLADVLVVLQEGRIISYGSLAKVCEDLGKQNVLVSNLSNCDDIFERVRISYPAALVNKVGTQLSITGEGPDLMELRAFIQKHDRNGARIELSQPSLVDAMNYHLRSIERPASQAES